MKTSDKSSGTRSRITQLEPKLIPHPSVRRSSIYSSTSSPTSTPRNSPPPALNLEFEYFTADAPTEQPEPPSSPAESVDFPLFSTAPTRLTLRSPTPEPVVDLTAEWDAVAHSRVRPDDFYFAHPTADDREKFSVSAAGIPESSIIIDALKIKRKQPGKKQRIKSRKAVAAEKAKAEAARREAEEKAAEERRKEEERLAKLPKPKTAGMTEEEVRAEKAKRNKEKKEKKKARDKAKKEAEKAGKVDGGGDVMMTEAEAV